MNFIIGKETTFSPLLKGTVYWSFKRKKI